MGTMIMNMCGGGVERNVSTTAEYDDEIQNAGWNPVVALEHVVPYEKPVSMPAELAAIDVEQFLKKMYSHLC
jgi:hypothetical protein